jgi:beta-glucosidase
MESNDHADLALRAARESIVLLKNDSLLPLSRSSIHSIAVLGPHGNDVTLGGYSGQPYHTVSALAGIRTKFADLPEVRVSFEPGASVSGPKDEAAIDAAAVLAANSDVAIVFVGTDLGVLSEEHDRPDWSLPGAQGDLISAVVAVNPRTVVVLVTAGPLAVDSARARVPAIVATFYNGQEQGTAIADVLFGDVNPGGKLTTTWYTGNATLPPIGDYDLRKGRTYLYYDGVPLFPFGHGLSYTTFDYSNLVVGSTIAGDAGSVTVTVDVSNMGSRAGAEVVQLYIRDPSATVPRPTKQLRGFRRLLLDAGQKQTVTFSLSPSDLAYWDAGTHGWRVEPGRFEVAVGSSSADIRVQDAFTVP